MTTDALYAERNLSTAVLHAALRDYASLTRRNYSGHSPRERGRADAAARENALAWFLADDPADTWPFTLRNVCLRTGRSHESIRNDVLRWEQMDPEDRKRVIGDAVYQSQEHKPRHK
jgi:hypothetical protein